MAYLQLVEKLNGYAEEEFAAFQRKLIFTKYEILGVRTPTLRKLAKEVTDLEELLAYPDEYYEVVFIKLSAISALPFREFLPRVEKGVSLMDNWALCDCFKAKCIAKNKQAFLPVLEKLFNREEAYYIRYVLVSFLSYYVEERYLPIIKEYIRRANTKPYYVHTAIAWLVAEILIKQYDEGVALLQEGALDKKTHNKAIQKALESYRVTQTQKEYLRSLKIK